MMTNEEFEALVRLIKVLAHEAVIDARPAHNRLAQTDGGESEIYSARLALTESD